MGKALAGIGSILAGVWIGWVMFFGSAGTYFANNPEKLIAANGQVSELMEKAEQQRDEAKAKICDSARERFQRAWDKAVESDRFEQREEILAEMEREVERRCG